MHRVRPNRCLLASRGGREVARVNVEYDGGNEGSCRFHFPDAEEGERRRKRRQLPTLLLSLDGVGARSRNGDAHEEHEEDLVTAVSPLHRLRVPTATTPRIAETSLKNDAAAASITHEYELKKKDEKARRVGDDKKYVRTIRKTVPRSSSWNFGSRGRTSGR